MRRMRLVGLALVAVLALSAVVAAAAQAEPEFKKAGAKNGFTTSSGTGEMKAGSITIKCTSDHSSGTISSSKTVSGVVVTFEGCIAKEGSKECKTGASEDGVITTAELVGKLVETETGSDVGLQLEPSGGGSYVTVVANCLAVTESPVTGQIVGEVKPLNTKSLTGEVIYRISSSKQQIRKYVYNGKSTSSAVLKAFSILEAPLSTTETVTFEEETEVS